MAIADDFRRDGYVRLPGLISPVAASGLLDAIQRASAGLPGDNELSTAGMDFASNVLYHSPELQAFVSSRAVIDVVCPILGPDVWARWDQAVRKGDGAGWFPWHQDNGYTRLAHEHLQLWLALTRSGPDNGGLLVAPGQHRQPAPHRWEGAHAAMDAPADTVAIDAEPGDVVVFSSFLPHATAPYRSGGDRWAYVVEFLRLADADWSIPPPHFVVSRGGNPAPGFEDLQALWPAPSDP